MNYNVAVIPGDGIGPEIVDSAVEILKKTADKFGHKFNFTPYLIGGAAIDATGKPLPEETVKGCLASDSVLLGAVGGPKWDSQPGNNRPEKGLLAIREDLGLFANLRRFCRYICRSFPFSSESQLRHIMLQFRNW